MKDLLITTLIAFAIASPAINAAEPENPIVIFDTDFAIPGMQVGDGSGTPVCIDDFSGLFVAGCDGAVGPEGPIGPQGPQGEVGPAGATGSLGTPAYYEATVTASGLSGDKVVVTATVVCGGNGSANPNSFLLGGGGELFVILNGGTAFPEKQQLISSFPKDAHTWEASGIADIDETVSETTVTAYAICTE